MNGNRKRAITLIELLVVLAILAILARSVVPTAELITVRMLETQLQENLKEIRRAIRSWREDCEAAVEREVKYYLTHIYGPPRAPEKTRAVVAAIPDWSFYPPDIGSLTKEGAFAVEYRDPSGVTQTAIFNHRAYLSAIPINPFAQAPVWAQYYASGTAYTIWEVGQITGGPPGSGVFDVGVPPSPSLMKGFVQALDGTYYRDW